MCAEINKKAEKQFALKDKENCKIYLRKIITTAVLCFRSLERFIENGRSTLESCKTSGTNTISYLVYSDMLRQFNSVEVYLLNIFGDLQESSVSYIKYRQLIKKMLKKGTAALQLVELTDEEEETLVHFNRTRNWVNHIPESMLVAEQDLISKGIAAPESTNPIEVYFYNHCTVEYFEDLVNSYSRLYDAATMLLNAAHRDYDALLGQKSEIKRVFIDDIRDIQHLEAAKKSASVQGLVHQEKQNHE
ncbi:hypothetical protein ACH6CV_12575 [Bacillota bacterium Meth-B3]